MKILLDTNIVIHRESSHIKNEHACAIFKWFSKLNHDIYIHPLTITEINKNKNKKIVDSFNKKLTSYNTLNSRYDIDDKIKTIQSMDSNENDIIDTEILSQAYNGYVDILISEDKKIHEKAKILNISEKVFTIDQVLEKFTEENPISIEYKALSIKKEEFGDIDERSTFFNSFRETYKEFDSWFKKKSNETAYVWRNPYEKSEILGFLYIKEEKIESETYSDISPPFPPKNRLKIGTLKVESQGLKIGERFLKIIFDNALLFNVEEIYVTFFEDESDISILSLKRLLEEWGFKKWGYKESHNGKEVVMIKDFSPSSLSSHPKETYPFIDYDRDFYMTPIWPKYHTNLLPDSLLATEDASAFLDPKPHRNALQKVYICRSSVRPKSGDVFLFYKTAEKGKSAGFNSVISTIAIVEQVHENIANLEELQKICRKRSIFDENGVKEFWDYRPGRWFDPTRHLVAIDFLYLKPLRKKITLNKLLKMGIIKIVDGTPAAPRFFVKITTEEFKEIIKEGEVDESFIIN